MVNGGGKKSEYQDKDKPTQIRYSNITAAKGWPNLLSIFSITVMLKVSLFD